MFNNFQKKKEPDRGLELGLKVQRSTDWASQAHGKSFITALIKVSIIYCVVTDKL